MAIREVKTVEMECDGQGCGVKYLGVFDRALHFGWTVAPGSNPTTLCPSCSKTTEKTEAK